MNGVEILTSAQVVTEWVFNLDAFWTVTLIGVVIGVIIGAVSSINDCDWTFLILGSILGIIFGSMVGTGAGEMFEKPSAYETQYQVTISDEISMVEFLEHYEVIDRDGKIFTVREKSYEE